jgi:hypothetical protein
MSPGALLAGGTAKRLGLTNPAATVIDRISHRHRLSPAPSPNANCDGFLAARFCGNADRQAHVTSCQFPNVYALGIHEPCRPCGTR